MKNVLLKISALIAAMLVAVFFFFKIEIINKGGPVMIPIILCSVFAMAIILDRIVNLSRSRIDTAKFMEEITSALKRNRINEAIDACEQMQAPIAQIVKAGLAKHNCSRLEIKEAIEDAGLYEVPKLEKNLSLLATIAHVSPLLGLLGTVTGMVVTFQTIQQNSAALQSVDSSLLAKGIWESLITTVAGLVVAIPSFVAYNYLVAKVGDLIVEMEISATDLLNVLTQKK